MIGAAIVLPMSLLALGTFVPNIPYLGTIGTYLFPALAGPFLPLSLIGVVLVLAARRGGGRFPGAIVLIGMATATAAGAVTARHARVAAANGVSVNVLLTMIPRSAGTGATPDETQIYAQVGGQDLRLDIYRPAIRSAGLAPVAIHIHGGGWIHEDRSAKAANLRWLADRGYLAVGLDYALATASPTWETATAQVACGMTWVAANAAKYNGDAERLFVLGESAGGSLALTTAYAAAAGVARSSCGGHVPIVRAVAAMVPAVDMVSFYENPDPVTGRFARNMARHYLGGTPADYPDRARAVSATTYITSKAPPTFMMLSDNDHLVPIDGALQFSARAQRAAVPLRVVRFPSADHGVAVLYYSVANQSWLQILQQHFCHYGGVCAPP